MKTRLFSTVLLVFLTSGLASAQQFITATALPLGTNVGAGVALDFNGDGNLDLALGVGGGTAPLPLLSIELNNGDGTFTLLQQLTEGSDTAGGVVAGDWNQDGITDLAVGGTSGTVYIYFGVGGGTFTLVNQYPVGQENIFGLTTGDLNGDGITDLIAADGFAAVSVLLGQRDGNFSSSVTYLLPSLRYLTGITAADFNRDGKLDIAVSGEDPFKPLEEAVVYLGVGDGTLGSATETVVHSAASIASADLNHDGIPDLLLGGESTGVLLGKGDGTFQAAKYYSSFSPGFYLALADLDRDGNIDLLQSTGNAVGNESLSVLRGNADGSFQPAVLLGASTDQLSAIFVADVNHDGNLDAIVTDLQLESYTLFLGDGHGKFTARRNYNIRQLGVNKQFETPALAIGDMNSDGNPDVVLVDDHFGNVIVTTGQINGTFRGPKYVPTEGIPKSVALGDFNADGNLDVVTANGHGINVLLGDGHVDFPVQSVYLGSDDPNFVITGDVNGDGKLDVITANAQSISVFLNDGSGRFNTRVDTPLDYMPLRLAVADFNQDGKLDIVASNNSSKISVAEILLGSGDGTFTQGQSLIAGKGRGSYLALGDFTGDGKLDVLVVGSSLYVFPGDGDGTFQDYKSTQACATYNIQVGDFNRDGKLDAISSCSDRNGDGRAQFLIGQGDGTFQIGQSTLIDGDYAEGVADFNHDGALDVAFAAENYCKQVLSVLLNTGAK